LCNVVSTLVAYAWVWMPLVALMSGSVGDELRRRELLTTQLQMSVNVPGARRSDRRSAPPATIGGVGQAHPRSAFACITRCRCDGVSARRITVCANMIAPSTTASSALGDAAAAANSG